VKKKNKKKNKNDENIMPSKPGFYQTFILPGAIINLTFADCATISAVHLFQTNLVKRVVEAGLFGF